MPDLVLQGMRQEGIEPLVLCLDPSNWRQLEAKAGAIYQLSPVQLSKAISLMYLHGVQEVSLAGRVPHQILLQIKPWQLNWQALHLWWKLPDTRADTVLRAISELFDSRGFKVISSLRYLSKYLIGRHLNTSVDHDVLLGIAAAKTLGCIDIGQSVVVCKGSVVAVEALEGTDSCLDRVIAMGIEQAIFIKMSKPQQDLRFDVPLVGANTFKRLIRGKFKAIVVEKDLTICTEPELLKSLEQSQIQVIVADKALIKRALEQYAQALKDLSSSL